MEATKFFRISGAKVTLFASCFECRVHINELPVTILLEEITEEEFAVDEIMREPQRRDPRNINPNFIELSYVSAPHVLDPLCRLKSPIMPPSDE
jgi:hypothetical protein